MYQFRAADQNAVTSYVLYLHTGTGTANLWGSLGAEWRGRGGYDVGAHVYFGTLVRYEYLRTGESPARFFHTPRP